MAAGIAVSRIFLGLLTTEKLSAVTGLEPLGLSAIYSNHIVEQYFHQIS